MITEIKFAIMNLLIRSSEERLSSFDCNFTDLVKNQKNTRGSGFTRHTSAQLARGSETLGSVLKASIKSRTFRGIDYVIAECRTESWDLTERHRSVKM